MKESLTTSVSIALLFSIMFLIYFVIDIISNEINKDQIELKISRIEFEK